MVVRGWGVLPKNLLWGKHLTLLRDGMRSLFSNDFLSKLIPVFIEVKPQSLKQKNLTFTSSS